MDNKTSPRLDSKTAANKEIRALAAEKGPYRPAVTGRKLSAGLLLLAGLLVVPNAPAGILSVLTYNVAGLPMVLPNPPFFGPDAERVAATSQISPLLNDYDLVLVQEDFSYHDVLVSQVTHPHVSQKDTAPGPFALGLGDGLNTLSRSPFSDFTRITWNDCVGLDFTNVGGDNDCLTNKGISFARHELEPGIFLDVYNWHADAGSDDANLEARRSNVRQLYEDIETNSAGNTVLVLGDTNSRYTRDGDIIPQMLLEANLTDVWLELVRGVPPDTGPFLTDGCATAPDGPDCELIDKIFYRNGSRLQLTPLSYSVPGGFVDVNGDPLSDHLPLSAVFSFTAVPEPGTTWLLLCGLLLLHSISGTGLRSGRSSANEIELATLRRCAQR